MRGRPPVSSPEERRRVYQLADAGQSSRAIAESVFGSRGLNNRVLRLLERRRRTTFRGVNLEEATDEELAALLDDLETASNEDLGALLQAAHGRLGDLEREGG
jgi:hypothetical protein